jgi:uncharacterized membrane protein
MLEVLVTMDDGLTIIAGIPIPSTSPVFLAVVGFHVLLGLICTLVGIVAMLSKKGRGRHSSFGTIYFWCLFLVFASSTSLAVVRWPEDYHLFFIGLLSFASAYWGRKAMRNRRNFIQHAIGMGTSYILLLTAFYVDNGKNLPFWNQFPQIAFWIMPSAIGIPIIAFVLWRHPLIRPSRHNQSKQFVA